MARLPKKAVLALVLVAFLARSSWATWSIIIVDLRTGEIAVGAATCLTSFDLALELPVVVVGVGAACAQSQIDQGAVNRLIIRDQMLQGATPAQILALLASLDVYHQSRQYGIVDASGGQATFTGGGAGAWGGGVIGQSGDLRWAIQGNVLTGQAVVTAAQQAILNTSGDLPAKLMAAMLAARAMGGDGRCSCSAFAPTSCGAPPPSFVKSADIRFMITARQGDQDSGCNAASGCAAGAYFMRLNVAFQSAASPDPVIQLQGLFNTWRAGWAGRPDHHRSTVTIAPPTLPDDGVTQATATVVLRDWTGAQLPIANAVISVTLDPSSPPGVVVGAVTSQGNGIYTFPVTAGTSAGLMRLRVRADDGQGPVLLSPASDVPIVADALWASAATVGVAAGGAVAFVLDLGPGAAGRPYALAASGAGSQPGIPVSATLAIPLNPDPVFYASLGLLNSALLPNTLGTLSPAGTAAASLVAPPGALSVLQGTTLTFAFATLNPIDAASNPVAVNLLP